MTTEVPTIADHTPEGVRLAGFDVAEEHILRVKSTSAPRELAMAIAHGVYAGKTVMLRAIGAAAVGQAVKAIAISRGFTSSSGIDTAFVPAFATVTGDKGDTVSAMTFRVVRLR